MKGRAQSRSTLMLPRKSPVGNAGRGTYDRTFAGYTASFGTHSAGPGRRIEAGPREIPLADGRRGVPRHWGWTVEARFFQLEDLQIVISRASARTATPAEPARRVTLELWPGAGPRLLVVEWSGRRPYVVHRRDGDWLERLIRLAQHPG